MRETPTLPFLARSQNITGQCSVHSALDIPAGTAVRFEPGIERPVGLVGIGGQQRVVGTLDA